MKTTPSVAVALALNLRRLRERRRLSQRRLAALAGVSRPTIANIELSRYGSTQTSTLEALAEALGVKMETLLQ
jgi:transcriptional regulator with XRE-family HTH domain